MSRINVSEASDDALLTELLQEQIRVARRSGGFVAGGGRTYLTSLTEEVQKRLGDRRREIEQLSLRPKNKKPGLVTSF